MPSGVKPPCRFIYRATWASLFLSTVFAGGCAWAMVYLARHTPVDRPIEGVPLSARHVLIMFWATAAFAALVALLMVLVMIVRLFRTYYLTVGVDSITVPIGLLIVREVKIPYGDIKFIREIDVDGLATMTLVCARRKYSIASAKMPSVADFESLKIYLANRGTWRMH